MNKGKFVGYGLNYSNFTELQVVLDTEYGFQVYIFKKKSMCTHTTLYTGLPTNKVKTKSTPLTISHETE